MGIVRSSDDMAIEMALHDQFRDYYIRGEWYEASAELLAYIENESVVDTPTPYAVSTIYYTQKELQDFFPPINVVEAGSELSPALLLWLDDTRELIDKVRDDVDNAAPLKGQVIAKVERMPEQLVMF